jgi:hypothetical protein
MQIQHRKENKMKETILWAVKKGNLKWEEEIITTKKERIPDAIKWAESHGYDNFRISEINLPMSADELRKELEKAFLIRVERQRA